MDASDKPDEEATPGHGPAPDADEVPPSGPQRSQKPVIAGVFLLFLAGLGVFSGLLYTVFDTDPSQENFQLPGTAYAVSGIVRDGSDFPLNGTEVFVDDADAPAAVSDPKGRYTVANLTAGMHHLVYVHPAHGNLTLRLVVLQNETADVVLSTPPGEAATVDHASFDRYRVIRRTIGSSVLILAAVTAGGAVAAYRRRVRPLAFAACGTGFLAALPTLASPLGLMVLLLPPLALWMLVSGRHEFA